MGSWVMIINETKKEYLNPQCKYGEAVGHFRLMEKLLHLLNTEWRRDKISLVRDFDIGHISVGYKEITIETDEELENKEENKHMQRILLTHRFLNPNDTPTAIIGWLDIGTNYLEGLKSTLNLDYINYASIRKDGLIGWAGKRIHVTCEDGLIKPNIEDKQLDKIKYTDGNLLKK
jgi:hypothetical protein